MLSRPEAGSCEHIKLWLAGKPEDEAYVFVGFCAWVQYADYIGAPVELKGGTYPLPPTAELVALNDLARVKPHTFGALHQRAFEAWG